jgi:hypothetical protein
VKVLADFHDVDFTGCINVNGEDTEVSIDDFLKQFKTIQDKLDYLCDYGQWDVKRIKRG